MKNNILAIIVAAGSAVVGSSLFSAPAHAQLGPVDQDVSVEIDVPEVLFLRTFSTVSLDITEADLAGGTAVTTAGLGKDYDTTSGTPAGTTDGLTGIDQTSPFTGLTSGSITKNVDELYAIWSNNPNGGVNVILSTPTTALTGVNGGTASIVSATKTDADPATAPGLETPFVGGADIEFNLNGATQAGLYSGGVINVSVTAP